MATEDIEIQLDEERQAFVSMTFGDQDSEPVMMPVTSLAVLEDEQEREQLVASAWEYYQRGQFARSSINEPFVESLGEDLSKDPQITDILTRLATVHLAESYAARLESEVSKFGTSVADGNAKHLRVEQRHGEDPTIVLDLPLDWEVIALERVRPLTENMFAQSGRGPMSWYIFAEWLWVNQVASALGDLEENVGEDELAAMPEGEFDRALFDRAFLHPNSDYELGELVVRRLEAVAALFVEAAAEAGNELWALELLLGFRDLPPPTQGRAVSRPLIRVDFGELLVAVANRPDTVYALAPRRFEELVAHILERLGYDEVTLTPESRDGGYDISAIRRAEVESRILVECKRYTPPHKVGRPVVQNLMGVLNDRSSQATLGVVVTTSTFTADAKAFIDNNRWRVQGRDLMGLHAWIKSAIARRGD